MQPYHTGSSKGFGWLSQAHCCLKAPGHNYVVSNAKCPLHTLQLDMAEEFVMQEPVSASAQLNLEIPS